MDVVSQTLEIVTTQPSSPQAGIVRALKTQRGNLLLLLDIVPSIETFTMSAAPSFSSRPVIIASSRQRRLWPLSTPERPFCIRPNQDGDTPLGCLIEALAATNRFATPIIILSETAARDALPLISRHNAQAKVLLVPAGTGSGTAAVLAAMMEVNEKNPLPLSLIPASFHAENLIQTFEGLAAMAVASKTDQLAILMASRSHGVDLSFSLEIGERIPGKTFFSVRSFHVDRDTDMLSAMREMRSLVRGCGPVVVPPALLLDRLTTNFPTLVSACRNALQLADNAGQIIRPRGDFLRLVGRPGLVQLISPNLNDLGIYLASDDCRVVQSFRDPSVTQGVKNAALPVEVCGYKDAKIIASADGVLILRPGSEELVKDHYQNQPEPTVAAAHPTKPSRSFGWGSEEILADIEDAYITKRTIQPKQRLLFDVNTPFTRSIAMVSGTLKLLLGGASQSLICGDQTIIQQGSASVLVNDSNQPAIFVEIITKSAINENRLSA